MDANKIKVGKTYPYYSRTVDASRGKVLEVEWKATGHWVTLEDKALLKTVTVRASQVGTARP